MQQKNAQQNVQTLGLRDRQHTVTESWLLQTAKVCWIDSQEWKLRASKVNCLLKVTSFTSVTERNIDESVTGLQVVERRWPCACLSCTLRLLHPRVMSLWYQFGGRLGRFQGQCVIWNREEYLFLQGVKSRSVGHWTSSVVAETYRRLLSRDRRYGLQKYGTHRRLVVDAY
jgi:hypothetical protein